MAIGSNCCIDDFEVIAKANELCNMYTLDTISTGMTISFAMACFEEGLIGREDTGGLDVRFGDGEVVLTLIEQIARRQGFGDLLAEGSVRAAAAIGDGADAHVLAVKGQEVPMHDPRVKTGLGLQFALAPERRRPLVRAARPPVRRRGEPRRGGDGASRLAGSGGAAGPGSGEGAPHPGRRAS